MLKGQSLLHVDSTWSHTTGWVRVPKDQAVEEPRTRLNAERLHRCDHIATHELEAIRAILGSIGNNHDMSAIDDEATHLVWRVLEGML